MCLAGQRRVHGSRLSCPHICPPPSSYCYLQTGLSEWSPKDRWGSAAPHWRPGSSREEFLRRLHSIPPPTAWKITLSLENPPVKSAGLFIPSTRLLSAPGTSNVVKVPPDRKNP